MGRKVNGEFASKMQHENSALDELKLSALHRYMVVSELPIVCNPNRHLPFTEKIAFNRSATDAHQIANTLSEFYFA